MGHDVFITTIQRLRSFVAVLHMVREHYKNGNSQSIDMVEKG